MQALPRLRRREADTTSYVADYLTRSVRRASGFVLARYPIRISDWRIDPSNHRNLTFWMLVPRVPCVGRLGFSATIYPLGESFVL